MKFTCSLVLLALFNTEATNAIKVRDDLFKDLANDLAADMAKENGGDDTTTSTDTTTTATETKEAHKDDGKKVETKKDDKKKEEKKDETKKGSLAQKSKKEDSPKKDDKKKEDSKKEVKKLSEKTEDEIPMDNAAIKAYSSVIADAAEDSEPQHAVVYTQTIPDDDAQPKHENVGLDPMGSMIQNEISSIKEASIKAAQESTD